MPQLAPPASVSFVRAHSCHGVVCKPLSFGTRETTAKKVSIVKKKGGKQGKKQRTKVIVIIFLKQNKIYYVQVEGEGEGWEKNAKPRKYWEEYKERI